MHPAAWFIFINSLRISCALLAVSIILFVICGGDYVLHYDTYYAALTLSETPPALLLLSPARCSWSTCCPPSPPSALRSII